MADGQSHRSVQKRAAGDIHQLIADHHQIARTLAVSNRVQSPADAPARNIDRRKIGVLAQQGFGHLFGNRRGFEGLQRLQQGKAGGMFAEIGPEAGLVHLLVSIARVAQQDTDLARHLAHMINRPSRSAPDFPVVQPDIVNLPRRGQLGDKGKNRHALRLQRLDRLDHQGVNSGRDTDRIANCGQSLNPRGGVLRRQIFQKLDPHFDVHIGHGGSGFADRGGAVLVERAMRLQK